MAAPKGPAKVVVEGLTVKLSRGTRAKPYIVEYDKADEGGHVQAIRNTLEEALHFINHVLTHEGGLL